MESSDIRWKLAVVAVATWVFLFVQTTNAFYWHWSAVEAWDRNETLKRENEVLLMVETIVEKILKLTDGNISHKPNRQASRDLYDLLGPGADLTPAQRVLIGRAVGVIEASRGKSVSLSDRADILELASECLREAEDAR